MLKQIICWFKGCDMRLVHDKHGRWDKCRRCGRYALPDDDEGFA